MARIKPSELYESSTSSRRPFKKLQILKKDWKNDTERWATVADGCSNSQVIGTIKNIREDLALLEKEIETEMERT